MRRDVLLQLVRDREAKRSVALATNLESGEQRLLYPLEDRPPGDPLLDEARECVRLDRSVVVRGEGGGEDVFLHVFNPPPRIIVIGAVHIAQALAELAAATGFEVLVVDPREAFATAERFPGCEVSTDWPEEALARAAVDRRTAVVTLTHDAKLDDPALTAALRSEAFYVGALGSRRTHDARLARLRDAGFDDAALARIAGPVGLDIGARSAAEIALSIVAQVVQRLRSGG